ncbi:xanthine dehydrogenase family protein subunit M [Mesorhizobium sp. LSHC412B00]|uniref:FAD binding domain-containing protein n=1 Tax=Mesorhizobium sp. LSHC412B00 TaxID=1287285 RepID=UPI0003F78043|nr:FAD binding domain-containing protein [Mesorhizobium sp. LSHC412B00]
MTTIERFQTIAEAARSGRARDVHVLGGGTLLMRQLNYAPQSVARILVVEDPSMREVTSAGNRIRIGAGVTFAAIASTPDLAFLAPAARAIGGPAIRNMATVGGNLFAPSPYGDFTTALLAAGADVVMADGRTEALETFLAARGTVMRGLVAAVTVPRLTTGEFRFRKVTRVKPKGISVMSIAAHLPKTGTRFGEVRIAFGAMGPRPLRARAAEAALRGAASDLAGVQAALRVTCEGLEPEDDALASAWYRREVAAVHLGRLLIEGQGA